MFVSLSIVGATVWYAGAVGGALMNYDDCLADCTSDYLYVDQPNQKIRCSQRSEASSN